jgi:hypothetical protein
MMHGRLLNSFGGVYMCSCLHCLSRCFELRHVSAVFALLVGRAVSACVFRRGISRCVVCLSQPWLFVEKDVARAYDVKDMAHGS